MERFELKFRLEAGQWAAFVDQFGAVLEADVKGSPTGRYPVVSLYYDSPDWRCYWEKWRGVPSRMKLRVRVYGSRDGVVAPAAFVELKVKIDGRGYKHRLQTTLAEALRIGAGEVETGEYPREARNLLEQVRHLVEEQRFRPVCVVRYWRQAFVMRRVAEVGPDLEEPLRLTCDEQILCRFEELVPEPDDARFGEALVAEGERILEIKGGGAMPLELADHLNQEGVGLTSFSKYGEAVSRRMYLEGSGGLRAGGVGV